MKIFFFSIILTLFYHTALCDEENSLGGIKLLLNENMINTAFKKKFYYKFPSNANTKITLPEFGNFIKMQFYITIFSHDNIIFNFTDKGDLNIKILNLKTYLTGFNIFYMANFNYSLGVLNLEQNITLNSKLNDSIIYIPVFEYNEEPKVNFEFNSDYVNNPSSYNAFIYENVNNLFLNKTFNKDFIIFINNTMNFIYEKIPKDIEYFTNGVRLDLNMIEPIKPRKNSVQLNLYGFLYSQYIEKTQNRTKFLLSNIPSIHNISNQLYISTYSISSAFYTLFYENNRNKILYYTSVLKLKYMFPQIMDKYKTSIFYLIFTLDRELKIELLDGYMNIIFPAKFEIQPADSNSVYISQVEIVLNSTIKNLDYNKLRILLFIDDMNMNTLKIEKNEINNDTYFESHFQSGFRHIKDNIIEQFNNFMKENFCTSLPDIMGVEFKSYNFEHKNNYVIMNFDYIR